MLLSFFGVPASHTTGLVTHHTWTDHPSQTGSPYAWYMAHRRCPRNLFRFLALLTVALIFGSTAYSQAVNVRVKVLFDFVLDDRAFPAGEYVVQTVEDGSYALLIRNKDTKTSALTLSYLSTPSKTADQTMLVFHRVGKTYFLSEVLAAGVPVGPSVPTFLRQV